MVYLSSGIVYHTLSTWFIQYGKTLTENEEKISKITNATVKNAETKIPAYKSPF